MRSLDCRCGDLWFDYLVSFGNRDPDLRDVLGAHRPSERHGAERALPRSRPLDGPLARHCGAASGVAAGRRAGRPCIGPAPSGRGRRRAAQYAPRCSCSRGARRAASLWSRIGSAPIRVSRQATGSAGPSRRRGATPRASSRGRAASPLPSRRGWTRRFCTCRAGTVKRFQPAHLTSPDRFFETSEALALCLACAKEHAASAACWRSGRCLG